jgi:transposase
LIEKESGIVMPVRTAGKYLKRWNYTPRKPVKYAYERNDEKVNEWLEREYPKLKKRAEEQKGEIYWGDETAIKASDVRGRGYAPRGKTPAVNRTGKREHVSMVSAITNKGKVYWKLREGSINGERFLDFVKRLIRNKRHKVFLIVDNAKPHHSKQLKAWAEKNKEKIDVWYLPPYSPDLNPDEHINADVKQGVGSKRPKKNKTELRNTTEEYINMLKHSPKRIIKYFRDPAIAYAA